MASQIVANKVLQLQQMILGTDEAFLTTPDGGVSLMWMQTRALRFYQLVELVNDIIEGWGWCGPACGQHSNISTGMADMHQLLQHNVSLPNMKAMLRCLTHYVCHYRRDHGSTHYLVTAVIGILSSFAMRFGILTAADLNYTGDD